MLLHSCCRFAWQRCSCGQTGTVVAFTRTEHQRSSQVSQILSGDLLHAPSGAFLFDPRRIRAGGLDLGFRGISSESHMQVIVERVIELSAKGDCPADADLFFALVNWAITPASFWRWSGIGGAGGQLLDRLLSGLFPDVDAATEKARAVVAKLESIRVARSPSGR